MIPIYNVYENCILNRNTGKHIVNPAMLIDIHTHTCLKMGDVSDVAAYGFSITDACKTKKITINVCLMDFNKYKWLSLKDVEKIFNTVAADNNHPILEKLAKLQVTMFDIQSTVHNL